MNFARFRCDRRLLQSLMQQDVFSLHLCKRAGISLRFEGEDIVRARFSHRNCEQSIRRRRTTRLTRWSNRSALAALRLSCWSSSEHAERAVRKPSERCDRRDTSERSGETRSSQSHEVPHKVPQSRTDLPYPRFPSSSWHE